MFEGVIIKETLTDELLLDALTIDKVEIVRTDDVIKYWTMISFHSDAADLPQRLASVLIDDWFADMKEDNVKYIIFKDNVLTMKSATALKRKKCWTIAAQKASRKSNFIGANNVLRIISPQRRSSTHAVR